MRLSPTNQHPTWRGGFSESPWPLHLQHLEELPFWPRLRLCDDVTFCSCWVYHGTCAPRYWQTAFRGWRTPLAEPLSMPQQGLTEILFCSKITSDSVSIVQRATNSVCRVTIQQQSLTAHHILLLVRLYLYRLVFEQKGRDAVTVSHQSRSLHPAVAGTQFIIRVDAGRGPQH